MKCRSILVAKPPVITKTSLNSFHHILLEILTSPSHSCLLTAKALNWSMIAFLLLENYERIFFRTFLFKHYLAHKPVRILLKANWDEWASREPESVHSFSTGSTIEQIFVPNQFYLWILTSLKIQRWNVFFIQCRSYYDVLL